MVNVEETDHADELGVETAGCYLPLQPSPRTHRRLMPLSIRLPLGLLAVALLGWVAWLWVAYGGAVYADVMLAGLAGEQLCSGRQDGPAVTKS